MSKNDCSRMARRSWPLALVLTFGVAGCARLTGCWDAMMDPGEAALQTPQVEAVAVLPIEDTKRH